jgi:hypothetical protein
LDRITNQIVIVVQEQHCGNIKDFCEWYLRHWAVHNVDGDHKAVIVILNLLGVRHRVIGFSEMCGPGWVTEGILRLRTFTVFLAYQDKKNTEEA